MSVSARTVDDILLPDGPGAGAVANPGELGEKARLLLQHQRENWPMLATGAGSLATVQVKTFEFDGFEIKVQFNPGRIVSSSAKVDKTSISQRKCFLCIPNLPAEQKGVLFQDYLVLCNPFPIFKEHFTIPHVEHIPQRISGSFASMLSIAEGMGMGYSLFYNGPRCGASAPDHLHFQAGEYGFMPLDTSWEDIVERHGTWIADDDRSRFARVDDKLRRYVILESDDPSLLEEQFKQLYAAFSDVSRQAGSQSGLQPGLKTGSPAGLLQSGLKTGSPAEPRPGPEAGSQSGSGEEPMLNILVSFKGGLWRVIVFLRKKHRPERYFAESDEKMLFSPASVDFGGVCIIPVERDFHRITKDDLYSMFQEVSASPDVLDAVIRNM